MTTPNHTPDALRAQVAELCDIVADEIRFESLDRTSRLRRLIAIATRLRAPEPTGEARYSVAQIEKAVAEAWEVFTADVTHGLPKRGAAQVTDYVTQVLALDASPPAPAPEGETWRTCARCGLADANVLDLDTGAPCHPEWRHCVRALAQRLTAVRECAHEWVSMRNAVIESGEMCRHCGALRPTNAPGGSAPSTPPAPAPEGKEDADVVLVREAIYDPNNSGVSGLLALNSLAQRLAAAEGERDAERTVHEHNERVSHDLLVAADQRLAAYDALAGRAKAYASVDGHPKGETAWAIVRDLAAMREG